MNQEIKQRIDQIKKEVIPIDYKNTKVGVIPIDWECTHLNRIAEEITNRVGNGKYETLSISAGIGFVNQAKKFGKELSGKQYEKYIVLKRGDFSYNKGNSKAYPQGCIYRLKNRDTAAVPNVFESFTVNNGDANYYEQIFISGFLNKQLSKKINHGVRDDGLLNLTGKDFYNCYIPCPPLEEQQKIAEILMQCDKVIELYEQEIDELKNLKKAYLRKMFPQNGKNVPELRFAGFTDPWEQRKLKEFSKYVPSTLTVKDIDENGKYDLYDANNWIGKIDKPLLDNDYISIIKDGAGVGRVRKLSKNTSILGTMGAIIPQNSDYNFLFYTLEKTDFTKLTSGGTIPHIYFNQYGEEKFFIPSIFEQQVVGQYFVNLDNLITLHERKVEEQKNQKKSLMQLLLTGIVRVKSNK